MNMIKLLCCRFQQCLGRLFMFLVEGSSETGHFLHLSNYLFGVPNFETTKGLRVTFFFKMFKIWVRFEKCRKRRRKSLFFWDNCILICVVKLSLLRTEYFSLAANVLRSCPKNWQPNKRDFFQLNLFSSDQLIWLKWCDAHFNSAWARFACCLSRGPPKRDFLDVYPTTFSESVISEIQNLRRSSFLSKCSKSKLDFKKAANNW